MKTADKKNNTIENKLLTRIKSKGRGYVFSARSFIDLTTRRNIDWALSQLLQKQIIVRIARGLYYYPTLSKIVGIIPPSPQKVARAITSKLGAKIQPSGAYSANLLGISEQIPAKIEFLTETDERTIQINNREIILRKTTPRMMQMAGKISGLVTQALRFIGKDNVTSGMINQLKARLSPEDKKQLLKDLSSPPTWIADYFRQIAS